MQEAFRCLPAEARTSSAGRCSGISKIREEIIENEARASRIAYPER